MNSSRLNIPEISDTIRIISGHFNTVEAEWSYHKHQHPTYELLHCLDGQAIEWINGSSVTLSKGDWLFLNGGLMHSTITEPDSVFSYFTIHFDTDDQELRDHLSQCSYLHFSNNDCGMGSLFQELRNLLTDDANSAFTSIYKLHFYALFIRMVAELLHVIVKAEPRPHLSAVSSQELKLAHAIEQQLHDAIFTSESVEGIASRLFISRNHCTNVFQKVYGLSPHRYLSMLKLKKAKELILRSDESLEKIGESLGFSCASSFSRQFRRWTGHAPAQLRRRKQQE
jgi:AraC-like DNA-binding protein